MRIYAAIIGTIAGICLAYALLYFFIGLRRGKEQRLNLSFALFALGYAGTLLLGIAYRSQETAADFLRLNRLDGFFIWLAYVALNWYVAEYTGTKPKGYLWGITAVFTVTILAAMLTPTLIYAEMPALTTIHLPWNEEIGELTGEENIWGNLLLLAELATLGFIVVAGVRQWRRGQKQAALVLLAGMSWLIIALSYEIVAAAGFWDYLPLAESGFLGIAVALSLQMAGSVIETEKALAASERNLEAVVAERTAELTAAHAQLISQAQETAVVEERRRIARDLHDDVTQTVYAASLIAEVLPQVWERSPDEGKRNLVKLRQLVRGALAEMRTLLFELRPSALENADLETLLLQLVDTFTGRSRIPVNVTIEGGNHILAGVKVAVYRISQEALNNISKHADATHVSLSVEEQSEWARLAIVDNGRGFEPANAETEGMGMTNMRERAAAIQARLQVNSRPGNGTEVLLLWPRAVNEKRSRFNDPHQSHDC